MRGEKVFKDLFKEQKGNGVPRGRSANLLARRNHCLLDRYFYYGQYTDKRYETILENLCTEFFLTERTVSDIIDDNETYLQELKTKKPILSFLEMRWPHLKW